MQAAGEAHPLQAGLPVELLAVLERRGLAGAEALASLLDPPDPPPAGQHFADLDRACQRLLTACRQAERLAVCGDYDADGMTSTALLVGVLGRLGAQPQAAIPSRMDDGYGLNAAMVERLAGEGIRLLITVDNGVAAAEALQRAAELNVEVILTDHHTLPPQLPPHLALLHPALTPEDSPYRGLAGVGLAYVLAAAVCGALGSADALSVGLDLFCIGTIADMAPLTGVNRRWLIDGLPRLASTRLPGLAALQQVAGLEGQGSQAEAVGFQLAPRINAVGRLGDPLLVVELLTTDDPERALELARRCEDLNRQRRQLCAAIEAEALALLEADGPQLSPFLLLAQNHWHHGVIGIVASRLVERFGRPVALLAAEGNGRLRASVRAPRGFAVDRALQACSELLLRHGGHPAAGGFTVQADQVTALHDRLNALSEAWLGRDGGGPVIEPEAHLPLPRVTRQFWRGLQRLEPFGSGHPVPLFWARACRVRQSRLLRGGHLQLELEQQGTCLRAIAWRWEGGSDWNGLVDVAFRLRQDHWQGQERLQLEVVGLRDAQGEEVLLRRQDRTYHCRLRGDELVIRNAAGEEICADAQRPGEDHHPYVLALLRDAATALGVTA
ncbi:MAG: single-stranded-DNA-specific exonuclease RecJ [Synechococcaceae cyanobacterium]|nr:single-stranded-DNA-specific exonuclease RecJ [Synechococcaceae cyanobacterium]